MVCTLPSKCENKSRHPPPPQTKPFHNIPNTVIIKEIKLPPMAPQIKASLLLVLLILIPLSSGAVTEGFKDGMNIIKSFIKDGIAVNSRKLLGHDLTDYDYAGANPKHDPCKRGRSNCPKNP